MLDMKQLRNEYDLVENAMARRGMPLEDIQRFPALDNSRRELLQVNEQLKNRRNTVSQEVAKLKKSGEDAEPLIIEMRDVSDRISSLDEQLRKLETELQDLVLSLPNIPHESLPVGRSEAENVEIRRWAEAPAFSFEPKTHWDIAQELGILDFEAAAKVTGSR
ncbi:MAG TPA: serine--tRNA ligase, partial [Bacilli bacterium]